MKKFLGLLLFVFVSMTVAAQTKAVYVNPKFYSLARNHHTLAVLPFSVEIGLRPKERESMTDQQIADMERKEGVAAQNALVSWFLKKQKSKPFSIEFQDVQATNALLMKSGINVNNIAGYTPQELAKILDADAVIGGLIQTTKPISEGASIAMGVLIGVYGPTNSGNVTISLSNAADGSLLWKYDKQLSRSLGSDMTSIMDTLMRKASKEFPYMNMDKYKAESRK